MEPHEILALVTPDKGWLVNELEELRHEWEAWFDMVENHG
jgi:hypothetical protein